MNEIEKWYDVVHASTAFLKTIEGKEMSDKDRDIAFGLFLSGWTARNIPDKKEIPGRHEFFTREEEIAANSYNEGWNAFRAEMLK